MIAWLKRFLKIREKWHKRSYYVIKDIGDKWRAK